MKRKEAYKKLMNTKVFVSNEAISKAVQDMYFKAGFTWAGKEAIPKYTDKPFLYADSAGLSYGKDLESFRKNSSTEYYANEILSMEIEDDFFDNANDFIKVAKCHTPFGLLYSITDNDYVQILKINDSGIITSNGYIGYRLLARHYKFADGNDITK